MPIGLRNYRSMEVALIVREIHERREGRTVAKCVTSKVTPATCIEPLAVVRQRMLE